VEDKLISEVGSKFENLADAAFEKLDSPDHFVHMSSAFKEGSSNIILRATTVRPRASEASAKKSQSCASEGNAKIAQAAAGGAEREELRMRQ
jgi:hypothetical protein